MSRLLLALPLLALLVALTVSPQVVAQRKGKSQDAPDDTIAQVRIEGNLKAELWAAEPLLQNPVAFCFDEHGRIYVAEAHRLHSGVTDTRSHMYWMEDDLGNRTVADMVAMFHRQYPGQKPYLGFEKSSDLVRKVWDSDNDGKPDKSSVYADGFNKPEDGLIAGVLARKGDVYVANMPALYKMRDTKGANKADVKDVLSTGYGVRVQFLGHDLHGLRMGPDGKLYFSCGDRGLNVTTKDVTTKEVKKVSNPDSGAVLRCNPDGSNLEIVHTGLRNPQELAFDDYGNLFTYDNNCDSGDAARWVQIVEGGDSGWRCGYQYGSGYHTPGVPQGNRGPWNTEKIWHVPGPNGEPPAYVVPPLKHFGNGPSGITHYPGIGLADRYKDHFFCADFTANAGGSKIWSLAVKPKGASFEVVDLHEFVKGMVPTDCEFGPDGAFYWSDWISGWGMPGKGRIFRVTDPEAMKNPAIAEAKKLLAEGFEKKTPEELAKLLEHPHQQVRLEVQLELVGRAYPSPPGRKVDEKVVPLLAGVLKDSKSRVARLHAIWGLRIFWNVPLAIKAIVVALKDPDAEVRKHAVEAAGKMKHAEHEHLGEGFGRPFTPVPPGGRNEPRSAQVAELLKDPDLAVRAAALQAYVKLVLAERIRIGSITPGSDELLYGPVFEALKTNNDADAYLRHAAVHALTTSTQNPVDLWNAWTLVKNKYDTPAVRLGVLLALRRLHSDKAGEFLTDPDPKVAVEAARAVHDERIGGAMAKLAELADKPGLADAIAYRALSANHKLATHESAARIARFAARQSEPDHTRVFALKLLADWAGPYRRDHVTGLAVQYPNTPAPPRPVANVAADALRPVIASVFAGPDSVRNEAGRVSAKLGIKEVGPVLIGVVKDEKAAVSSRVDALLALASLKDSATAELTAFALASPDPKLRAAGLSVKAKTNPDEVLKTLPGLLNDGKSTVPELQTAFTILGSFRESPDADRLLDEWLAAVIAGKARPELALDIIEAAEKRTTTAKLKLHAPLKAKLDEVRGKQAKADDKLGPWSETLAGGDAEKGRDIFLNNSAVYCQRCHKLDNQGGDVGPPLNGIAAEPGKDRRYLLESIVLPSAQIAKGYETTILNLADGRLVSGIVKEETKKQIRLVTPENKELVIAVDEIETRRTGPSAMPDDLHKKLTRRELRDVVEFLASLREPAKKTP